MATFTPADTLLVLLCYPVNGSLAGPSINHSQGSTAAADFALFFREQPLPVLLGCTRRACKVFRRALLGMSSYLFFRGRHSADPQTWPHHNLPGGREIWRDDDHGNFPERSFLRLSVELPQSPDTPSLDPFI